MTGHGFGHNEIAIVCRKVLLERGGDPAKEDGLIYDYAKKYNGSRNATSVEFYFNAFLDQQLEVKGGDRWKARK